MLTLDRDQVMAYRIAAHELHRPHAELGLLAVLALGVQDAQQVSSRLAIAARLDTDPNRLAGPSFADALDTAEVTLAWSHRGAPHLHHAADLPDVAASMVPLSDADALARLSWQRGDVAAAGMPVTEALSTTAAALRQAVDATMTKGTASERVTRLLPEGLSRWCRGCQATHVHEQLMRLSTLRGGIRLEPDVSPATLTPMDATTLTDEPAPEACTRVAAHYLHLHGPATPAEVAGFLGTTRKTANQVWPDGLAEVDFDGKRVYLPEADLPVLENPPEPDLVRLLPPSDPLLQARDRLTLVPDKADHKAVWRIIGNPGVVLADGEIAATWRGRARGRKQLDVTVSPLRPLRPATRDGIDAEAARVATARGFAAHTLTVT